jgi:hypothetical protein
LFPVPPSLKRSARLAQRLRPEACITAYHKAAAEAQRVTKQAIRDWKENLDKKASAEFSSKGTLALQSTMETQVSSDIERLKDCLTKTR